MTYAIPSKTFLEGEYLALEGYESIVITTTPCFLINPLKTTPSSIHPDSPAGLMQKKAGLSEFEFIDPYNGLGGFGASSAQFIGAYLIWAQKNNVSPSLWGLVQSYRDIHETYSGKIPSGYDVIAQALGGIVFIHSNEKKVKHLQWAFKETGFLFFHTQHKLATHTHLNTAPPLKHQEALRQTVLRGLEAFEKQDSILLAQSINGYAACLRQQNLMTSVTAICLDALMPMAGVLAAKGCGALGSDVIMVLAESHAMESIKIKATQLGLKFIADNFNVAPELKIIQNF
jgi:mevalonate kinase